MNKVADIAKEIGGWLIVVAGLRVPVWAIGLAVLASAVLMRVLQ